MISLILTIVAAFAISGIYIAYDWHIIRPVETEQQGLTKSEIDFIFDSVDPNFKP